MQEKWLPVKGYEDFYQISSHGRVRSLRKNKIMSPADNGQGYLYLVLCKDNKKKNILVHRLVVETFIGDIPKGMAVNHKDKNKKNNNVKNLEVVTYSKNQLHAKKGKKRGIRKHNLSNRWQAEITFKGKVIYIGLYEDKEEAYKAFNKKYKELYGEKAW